MELVLISVHLNGGTKFNGFALLVNWTQKNCPSLLQQFDDKFAKLGVVTTGLELDDFVEYVDVPLSTLHAIDDNDLLAALR